MAGLVVAMSTMSSVLSATALLFSTAPAIVQAHGLFLMLLSCILHRRTQMLYRLGARNRVVAALAGLLPMAAPSWVGLVPRR